MNSNPMPYRKASSVTWVSMLARLMALAPSIIFLALLVYLAIAAPNLLELSTLNLILKQSIPTVIVCLGLATVVMAGGDDVVSGGIDLSIPATAVLCAAIIADQLVNHASALPWALALGMSAAVVMGLLNAVLVVLIGMTPLLATLASSVAAIGISKVVTSSRRINVDDSFIIFLRDAQIAGVSVAVMLTAILALIFYVAIHRTRWGMHLQAAGGSRDAAETSGIPSRRLLGQAFFLAALAGGLASVFVLARGSGSTPGSEENLLLEMVLATFMGAAFSPRRVVTLWGAVLGAVLVSLLSVGFKSVGVDVFWTGCIKGALILLVVASAAYSNKLAN